MLGVEKLTIKPCCEGPSYYTMINPEKINLDYSTVEKSEEGNEKNIISRKVSSGGLDLELVIDCTGVVDSDRVSMNDEISQIKDILYKKDGEIIHAKEVDVIWGGGLSFKGFISSTKIAYNLFSPDGKPLRAKVSLTFSASLGNDLTPSGSSSPNTSKMVSIVDGDSLPKLALSKYRQANMYIHLAKFNNLNSFRKLAVGAAMILPPLISKGR